MSPRWPLLAIGGPTAAGKTDLAVELARRVGAELVNADSRQVIRRLHAGTAAPSDAQLRRVRCHLLGICEPGDPFTVADWVDAARLVLADLRRRGVAAILVGGTGQYLRALREGWVFRGAAPDPAAREALTALAGSAAGLARLAAELQDRDPEGAASVDLANPRRVIRALEVLRAGAGSLADARRRAGGIPFELVVLDAQRAPHRDALVARVDAMFYGGALLAETADELRRGTPREALGRAGIGYSEAIAVIDGTLDLEGARSLTLQRTLRYAKAQRTWFRSEPALLHLDRAEATTTSALADAVLAAVRQSPGGRCRGSPR